MIESRHTLSYCALCERDMVVCADCGNNCCNGGTGNIGKEKCGCVEAYADQDAYNDDQTIVKFTNDIRLTVSRELPDLLKRNLTLV